MLRWSDELRHLRLEEIGERYARYRLYLPEAERAMVRSLSRYGQISPVVVCEQEGVYELIDGFKRFSAARHLKPIPKLSCRLIEVDERGAKAAIYGLNRVGGRTRELGRSLDRSCSGSRRRVEPGGGGGAAGPSQELGLPTPGAHREAGSRGKRAASTGSTVSQRGAPVDPVAGGQPETASACHPSGSAFRAGAEWRGRSVGALVGPLANKPTCCNNLERLSPKMNMHPCRPRTRD